MPKWTHKIFVISLAAKAVNAALEIVGGALLFLIPKNELLKLTIKLTSEELSEDPRDFIANQLIKGAEKLSFDKQIFGAIYLFSHGLIKIALIAALLKKKLWAYPIALVVFALFIIYQMYRFSYSHSPWMIVLSVFDLFVIILTVLEYRKLKKPAYADF